MAVSRLKCGRGKTGAGSVRELSGKNEGREAGASRWREVRGKGEKYNIGK